MAAHVQSGVKQSVLSVCLSVSQSVSPKPFQKLAKFAPPTVITITCKYGWNAQMVFKITESMDGVAVPPTLYGQYNVFVQKEALSERPNSPRGTYSSNTLVVCAIRPLTQHSFSPSNSTTCTIPPLLRSHKGCDLKCM